MNAESAKANRKNLTLEVDLAKVRRAIAHLLDILESEVGSDALVECIQAKVKEAQLLEAAIIARDKSSKSPSSAETPDLEMVYDGLFERLDSFLAKPTEVVIANELMSRLISEVRVHPDENARDGFAVMIHGDLARMVTAAGQKDKRARGALYQS
ncbi:hypothetical protein [uncultured Jannaschia sp.]|uniref:hypothetical protein n=1 Tax=uncultured Jannaschia sp. TaxID=293347 RepID=UPI0026173965|nr:hypothetical protein [uncultured Jannaschia sp.]